MVKRLFNLDMSVGPSICLAVVNGVAFLATKMEISTSCLTKTLKVVVIVAAVVACKLLCKLVQIYQRICFACKR